MLTAKHEEDVNEIAHRISNPKQKDPAAVSLGSKGGKARAKSLSAKRKKEIAKKAAEERWLKQKKK